MTSSRSNKEEIELLSLKPWVRDFYEHGFVVLPALFSDDEVQALRVESTRILALLLNSSLVAGRTSRRLDLRRREDGQAIVRKIQPLQDLSPLFQSLSADIRIIDRLRHLMDGEPLLMEEKLTYKLPLQKWPHGLDVRDADDRFFAHNDWAYHRAQGYTDRIIGVGVFLDSVTPVQGPLEVWSGSHHRHAEHIPRVIGLNAIKPHDDLNRGTTWVIPDHVLNGQSPTPLLGAAGTVVIFHCLLVHRSGPNRSPKPRRMLLFHYTPSDESPGPDVRNGQTRATEYPYEETYRLLSVAPGWRDPYPLSSDL
jgi:hypothetical protein